MEFCCSTAMQWVGMGSFCAVSLLLRMFASIFSPFCSMVCNRSLKWRESVASGCVDVHILFILQRIILSFEGQAYI